MFKLLNEESYKLAVKEYEARRLVLALSLLSIVLAAGIIELLPSYLVSNSRKQEAASRIEVSKHSYSATETKELQAWLATTNKKLSILSPEANTDKPYELFTKIITLKPAGVSLTGFRWKKSDSKITISVFGTAKDRQSLLAFQEQLNSSSAFSKATLPVSSFAKDHDLEFELSITPFK